MGHTFLLGVVLSFFIFVFIASVFLYKATKRKKWMVISLCAPVFSTALIFMNWPTRPSDQAYREVLQYIQSQEKLPSDGVTT